MFETQRWCNGVDHVCAECAIPSDGYEHMQFTLAEANLPSLRIPHHVQGGVRQVAPWHWTSLRITPDVDDEYFMRTVPELGARLADHVVVSQFSHGLNSCALTWRMTVGPLAMVLQHHRGIVGRTEESENEVREFFGQANRLVETADLNRRALGPAHTDPWIRPVVLVASPHRQIFKCWVWVDDLRRHLPLKIGHHKWGKVASAVAAAVPLGPSK